MLELACGTGLWTRHLVRYATRVTAVDAAPEVLAINRDRVGDETVRYVQADLFGYAPEPAAYDACVFTFWLSHVPDHRFAAFWDIGRCGRWGPRAAFCSSTAPAPSDRPPPTTCSPATANRR